MLLAFQGEDVCLLPESSSLIFTDMCCVSKGVFITSGRRNGGMTSNDPTQSCLPRKCVRHYGEGVLAGCCDLHDLEVTEAIAKSVVSASMS